MFFKLFFLLVIHQRVALIRSAESIDYSPHLQTIQNETFEILSRFTRLSLSLNKTQLASDRQTQNLYFFPALVEVRSHIERILFSNLNNASQFSTNKDNSTDGRTLDKSYALARILDQMEQLSRFMLRFRTGIYYNHGYSYDSGLRQNLDDLRTHFHADTIGFSDFNSDEDEKKIRDRIRSWFYVYTFKYHPSDEELELKHQSIIHLSVMSLKSCWDTPKTAINAMDAFLDRRRRRRFAPPVPKFPTLNFDVIQQYLDLKAFTGKEKVGYYNDVEKKYQAIKIPFSKHTGFAMAVILPNYDQSLEILAKFTAADYRRLLQRVNETYVNVRYTIPYVNSSIFHINEEGIAINEGRGYCYTNATASKDTNNGTDTKFKPFVASRPFAALIYDDRTGLVLMNALVRNLTSTVWNPHQAQIQSVNGFGQRNIESLFN